MKEIMFSKNLKELRKSRSMTQTELAKLVGVDQRTVSGWETGVSEPSYAILAKLCEIFEETFDGLLS